MQVGDELKAIAPIDMLSIGDTVVVGNVVAEKFRSYVVVVTSWGGSFEVMSYEVDKYFKATGVNTASAMQDHFAAHAELMANVMRRYGKCTCGSHVVNGPSHSYFCDLFVA